MMNTASRLFSLFLVLPLLTISACFNADENSESDTGPKPYADIVVTAPGHTGLGFKDSRRAVNGVRGGGCTGGSTDVFSLDYDDSAGSNSIILRWKDRRVTNGDGTDLVVFENAFDYGSCGSGKRFMDQVVVSVSEDGVTWVDFPHDYTNPNETEYSTDPQYWFGFAGVTPVLYHEENNPVDPFDTAAAGGDHFDLDDLPSPEGDDIKQNGFIFIKLTTAPSLENPDTPEVTFVKEAISDGADIDGVYARYFSPE